MSDYPEELRNILEDKPTGISASLESEGGSMVSHFRPILRKSVNYIVACVLLSENDEVLLIQEAKSSCYGSWYLPAGRVDPNETLVDAVIRETKEEAGVDLVPEALVLVEFPYAKWYRFTFIGRISGGRLKDFEDKESIQAKWWHLADLTNNQKLQLRCPDILPIIQTAKKYSDRNSRLSYGLSVVQSQHQELIFRFVIFQDLVIESKCYNIVYHGKNSKYLPRKVLCDRENMDAITAELLHQVFKKPPVNLVSRCVLSIEHDGSKMDSDGKMYCDGFCMTLAICIPGNDSKVKLRKGFSWCIITDECEWYEKLNCKLKSAAVCVQ